MKKQWLQYGLIAVAVVAAGVGVTHVNHPGAKDNNAWVAAVSQRSGLNAVQSPLFNQTSGIATMNGTGNVADNTSGSASGGTSPAPVTPPSQKNGGQSGTSTTPSTSGSQSNDSNQASDRGTQHPAPVNTTTASPPPLPSQPNLGSFTVVVSQDKGQTLMSKKTLKIVKGESLMTYMHENYNITTAYGDDFMLAINGIKSQWTNVAPAQRQPVDWFLYVNGTSAPVGAGDIIPQAGDVDNWDYHRWNPSTGKG